MAKDPAFLFYFRDFLVSTALMTPGEIGSYMRILCHMADKGSLSMFQLKQIAEGGTLTQDVISRFRINDGGLYYSERLEEVMTKRKKWTKSRHENLSKGALHMGPHMGNGNANDNTTNTTTIEKTMFMEFVFMTQGQYDQLANKLGKTVLDEYVERLNNYIGSKGKKYKSHYHTILNWHSRDGGKKPSDFKPVSKKADPNCPNCNGDDRGIFAQGTSKYVQCKCTK